MITYCNNLDNYITSVKLEPETNQQNVTNESFVIKLVQRTEIRDTVEHKGSDKHEMHNSSTMEGNDEVNNQFL